MKLLRIALAFAFALVVAPVQSEASAAPAQAVAPVVPASSTITIKASSDAPPATAQVRKAVAGVPAFDLPELGLGAVGGGLAAISWADAPFVCSIEQGSVWRVADKTYADAKAPDIVTIDVVQGGEDIASRKEEVGAA